MNKMIIDKHEGTNTKRAYYAINASIGPFKTNFLFFF